MATITGTGKSQGDEVVLLTALIADVTALRAAIVGITAQLDADAGVTDTTYASGNDPAAITASLTV